MDYMVNKNYLLIVENKNMDSLKLNRVHHIAIICSNYDKSKEFYIRVLGLKVINEQFREDRQSFKLDLALNSDYIIELFSFPNPVLRATRPEACGLRHLAFEVDDLASSIELIKKLDINVEPIRVDELTNKRFTFIFDPDNLPIELYER